MSHHEEEEDVISSPLSSPRSSIFELDEFDFASQAPERAPGPALIDNLPPFHPQPEPAAKPAARRATKATTSTPNPGRSLRSANKENRKPIRDPDFDPPAPQITAHVHEEGCDHATPTTNTTPPSAPQPSEEHRPATPQSPEEPAPTAPTTGPAPKATTPENGSKKRKAPSTSSSSAAQTKTSKVVVKKARKNADAKKWAVPFVYTDSKSPLVAAPIRDILLHPRAWGVLSAGDRAELAAMLALDRPASVTSSSPPSPAEAGNSGSQSEVVAEARPDLDYLRSDDSFRFDCARYSENVGDGRHDEGWLAESWVAHERRKRGDFREYLAAKLERDWDVKLPQSKEVGEEGGDEDEQEKEEKKEGEGEAEAASGSPVASSVGENRLTELKLGAAVPDEGEKGAPEAEEGGEIVVG